jgi:hypothetical protein
MAAYKRPAKTSAPAVAIGIVLLRPRVLPASTGTTSKPCSGNSATSSARGKSVAPDGTCTAARSGAGTNSSPSSKTSGKSFATVSRFHTQALGRNPRSAITDNPAAQTSAHGASTDVPRAAPSWLATPANTAAVLTSAETPVTHPTIQPLLRPNALRAQTYGPPSIGSF